MRSTKNARSSRLFFLALILGTGCDSFQTAKFKPPRGVGDNPILVVPFSEPKRQRWYGESERGLLVAEAFKTWVMTNSSPNFPEGPGVEKVLDTIREWKKERIDVQDWKIITASLGVKYVVFGEIEDLSLKRPESVGFLDAWVTASYRVVDVQEEKTVWWRKSFKVDLARRRDVDIPILEVEADKAQMERRLLARLAEQVGRDLYGYTPDSRYN